MAYETPLTIFEVVQDISANKYILPAIQREFTWSTSQIEQLFDSLMQEYPIPLLSSLMKASLTSGFIVKYCLYFSPCTSSYSTINFIFGSVL